MNDKVIYTENGEDPESLEREINETRAEMNETLDSLERKLTAGQLLDQCLKFFGKTGIELGSSIGKSVKENPMPVLVTATGIAWMIFGSGQNRSPRRYSGYSAYPENLGECEFDEDNTKGEGTLSKMADEIKSGATTARSQLESSTENIKESISGTTENVKATVNKSTDAVKETVNRTTNAAQAQAQRAREGFNTLLEEQPLVLGAFGVALGALIGAALPSTEQEDRLVGDIRDKTMAKAKEVGAQTYEQARDAAKEKVAGAVQTASDKLCGDPNATTDPKI
jgi:ElaB/YqjD/DUF883 family membrane-anchored ribosome-binding protein